MATLAIYGGPKAVPDGLIRPWPPIDRVDRKYVLASLNGNSHACGPNCEAFEKEFAAWNGNAYAVTTNSGTAALHMAIAACGVGAGDHVLVTAYSWSSSATSILHHNAIPVFVDIDFETINIDPAKIEAAITPRTKALVVVHLHGLAVDMDRVLAIARKHNLRVIEDACQAHGALFNGRKVGLFGDCAAFSFNQNKCLCSGEGGMFVTNDKELLAKARQLWSFGETATPSEARDYHAYALGWMYRNNDLTAAFGRAQLAKLDGYMKILKRNGNLLRRLLRRTPGLILPVEPPGFSHTWYNFTVRLDARALGWNAHPARFRDAVMKALQAEGVPVGIWQHYILPAMTVFRAKNAYGKGCPWSCRDALDVSYDPSNYPAAQRHCDCHFGMTVPLRAPNRAKTVRAVAEAFDKVLNNAGQLDVDRILGAKT
jgi:dTDP-4-amino-4,6-dideoxygalactose transaminase